MHNLTCLQRSKKLSNQNIWVISKANTLHLTQRLLSSKDNFIRFTTKSKIILIRGKSWNKFSFGTKFKRLRQNISTNSLQSKILQRGWPITIILFALITGSSSINKKKGRKWWISLLTSLNKTLKIQNQKRLLITIQLLHFLNLNRLYRLTLHQNLNQNRNLYLENSWWKNKKSQ